MTELTNKTTSINGLDNQNISTNASSTAKGMLIAIGVLLLSGLFAVFAWGLTTKESTQLQNRGAPEFSFTVFNDPTVDMAGQEVTLSKLKGQIVVVNFWASWCVECYKEAALLQQAYLDYKDKGVVFIGIDYLDTDKEAMAYMHQYGITYPSGPDIASQISRDYRITGVPETFFIDKQGNIHHVQIGPIEQFQLYSLLDTLVAGEG